MKIIESITEMQTWAKEQKKAGIRIGFVPTMGFLHEGHMELIRQARAQTAAVVVSIFVNPLQFGPNEDFSRYPRDLEGDTRKIQEHGVEVLFLPQMRDFYDKDFETRVTPGVLALDLCGASRPGHFEGVATVVAKLFNVVLPDAAFFGQKDYQQLQVIKQLVKDLNFPVEIVDVATVRDHEGLALSSRNQNLSKEERQQALVLSRAFIQAQAQVAGKRLPTAEVLWQVRSEISQEKAVEKIDYVAIVHPERLTPLAEVGAGLEGVLLAAVWIAGVRLIDNIILGRPSASGRLPS